MEDPHADAGAREPNNNQEGSRGGAEHAEGRGAPRLLAEALARRLQGTRDAASDHSRLLAGRESATLWQARIVSAVGPLPVGEALVRSVAQAAAEGLVSRSELTRILKFVSAGRRSGKIKNPGGYFRTCARELFRVAGQQQHDQQHRA